MGIRDRQTHLANHGCYRYGHDPLQPKFFLNLTKAEATARKRVQRGAATK